MKGGMGGYQWCHDCESWGVPFPIVQEIQHADLIHCGNCKSENVTHYEAVYEKRNGKVTINPSIPVSGVKIEGGGEWDNGRLSVDVEVLHSPQNAPSQLTRQWVRVYESQLVCRDDAGALSHIVESLGIAKAKKAPE